MGHRKTPARKAPPTSKTPRALHTVKDLTHDPHNANKGTHRGRAAVEQSVRRFGFGRSVLTDRHGRIIAGNKTVEAAELLGDPDVVVVETTGDKLVVVRRTDLDLAQPEAQALAIADNRAGELGLAWDVGQLGRFETEGGDLQPFFSAKEWEALQRDGGPTPDSADEIPEMALQAFEEYNYFVVVFRNSQDWQGAIDVLGLKREAVTLGTVRKIGLGRVLDGARILEMLRTCTSASSSPRGNGSRRSSAKR